MKTIRHLRRAAKTTSVRKSMKHTSHALKSAGLSSAPTSATSTLIQWGIILAIIVVSVVVSAGG